MITPSQFAYSNYNYWTIPLSELPTRGQFYNPNAIIKLRGLSVMEVKFLATYQPAIATEICNEILTKCAYFENITLQDLYLPDRTYLIFWIRNNSFSNRNGYSIEVKECEHCKGAYTHNIKLEDFNIKQLDHLYLVYIFQMQMLSYHYVFQNLMNHYLKLKIMYKLQLCI